MEEQPVHDSEPIQTTSYVKKEELMVAPALHLGGDPTGHQADDEHTAHLPPSGEKLGLNEKVKGGKPYGLVYKHWEVSWEQGEFHLDEMQRYSSLEEVNHAIEVEKRKLSELSEEVELVPVTNSPLVVYTRKQPAIEYNIEHPPESPLTFKANNNVYVLSVDNIVETQPEKPSPSEEASGNIEEKLPSANMYPSPPTEYLYKPSVDPFQQSNKTVKSTYIYESTYNEVLHKSKDLEYKNLELSERNKQLEEQLAEMASKLAASEQKIQQQQEYFSKNYESSGESDTKQPSPDQPVKKKGVTDDGIKKILHAMESANKGLPVAIHLPKRVKPTRKGPLFSRDFKLMSNIYNIAIGEIMDLDHTWAKEEEAEREKLKTAEKKMRQTSPEIQVFEPSSNLREEEYTQTDQQQLTLEVLERKRFYLENYLQIINDQIRNDDADEHHSGRFNTARYNSSAMDWKDNAQKFGTEAEEQLQSNYQSSNPKSMYWHSLGKKNDLHLERSEAAIRKKHTMEDREDNPYLYPKKTITKHRSRPISKRRREETDQSKEGLRNLNDKNQQDNEDKAIQTPEIILSPGFKVTLKDLVFPMLPGKPEAYHTPKYLSELARKTFITLGVPIDESHSLIVKKFKNCAWFKVFDISIVWYYEGKFYIGGWKESAFTNEGEKEGHGIELIPGKYLYEGTFAQGRRHGCGKIKYENGDYYEGEWNGGVKEGNGKLVEANGIIYEGHMKDGRRDGYGKLTISPIEIYEGGFVRGIKNGRGKEQFKTGDSYEGDYVLGKFSGEGCYRWANGAMYLGQFHNGCRSGKGYWRSANATPCDTYDGEYQNDKKCGKGLYTWETGVSYEGYFMNDLRQGEGTVRYPNGKVIRAMWYNGVRKQYLYSEEKYLYKQARKRAESANTKQAVLPKVS